MEILESLKAEADEIKSAIADEVVKIADGKFSDFHDAMVPTWMNYYNDYIGKHVTGKEPKEAWRARSYFKFTKVKILSAASQIISAANANSERVSTKARDGNEAAAARMKDKINRQFEACRMNEKIAIAAMDGLLYGTFYLQAPAAITRMEKRWVQRSVMQRVMAGLRQLSVVVPRWDADFMAQRSPVVYNRNIFEMYPDPFATGPDDGEGIIHRPFISKHFLADLRNKKGFDQEAIDLLIKAGPSESSSNGRDGVEEKLSTRGYSSSNRSGYDLIFFTGKFPADSLRDNGIPGFEDTYGYIEMWAWVVKHSLGNFLLKCIPSPLSGKGRPFHSSVFERVPYESQGVGVAENMKDIAELLNGGIRMFIDAKKLSMPQLAVNEQMLNLSGGKVTISPLKVWRFKSGDPRNAIVPIQFPDVSDGLITMIEMGERFADEITGIPKWTTGVDSKMLNKTASGMGMIMQAQGQLMRSFVENIDGVVREIGEQFYDWNMDADGDENAKADMDIIVNGLSQVMAKDVLTSKMLQLLSYVVNPAVLQNPYAVKWLRMVGDNMGVKDVDSALPKPEELNRAGAPGAGHAALTAAGGVSAPPGANVQGAVAPVAMG